MMVVMVDKMLKTQIVECSTIAKFVFSEELRPEFTSFYLWEILNSTVSRMSKQVEKLQIDYDDFEERFKKTQSMFADVTTYFQGFYPDDPFLIFA
jgi:nuclear cap-binding protein subunit 1